MPMGVPKMWEEGRLKVEPARENTCWEEQTLASLCSCICQGCMVRAPGEAAQSAGPWDSASPEWWRWKQRRMGGCW